MSWAKLLRFWWIVPIAALAFGLIQTRERLAEEKLTSSAERSAHEKTISNFNTASEKARRMDAENALRVRQEQDAITREIVDDYEAELGRARARVEQLRANAADRAVASRGDATAVPGVPDAATGTDEAPGKDRLPVADALIATEQALQLDALIRWVEAQAGVGFGSVARLEGEGSSGRGFALTADPIEP